MVNGRWGQHIISRHLVTSNTLLDWTLSLLDYLVVVRITWQTLVVIVVVLVFIVIVFVIFITVFFMVSLLLGSAVLML